jgi:hypothetical protein
MSWVDCWELYTENNSYIQNITYNTQKEKNIEKEFIPITSPNIDTFFNETSVNVTNVRSVVFI